MSCCDGGQVNIKKTRRIYNEFGLQLRNKHPKRRVKAKLRDNRAEAVGSNDVWAWILFMTSWHWATSIAFRPSPTPIPLLSRRRSSLHLSQGGCCPDFGKDVWPHRLSQNHPGRQWQRVHLPRSRSVAYAKDVTGVLATRQRHACDKIDGGIPGLMLFQAAAYPTVATLEASGRRLLQQNPLHEPAFPRLTNQ